MRTNGCMCGFLSWSPLQGSERGFVSRKFLWAYFFWGQWRVSQGEYTSRYGRDQHSCEIYLKLGGHNCNGTLVLVVICVQNLTHFKVRQKNLKESIFVQFKLKLADFRRVTIFGIPGTHIQLTINNFTETLYNVDDWLFYFLSLCLFPFFVYYQCRFVTVCTVKRFRVGAYVTVIFHILSIENTDFRQTRSRKKKDRKISQTPSTTC